MILYHLADLADVEAIERDGFQQPGGTYKATGMALDGVFFSETILDSNEDVAGSVVFAIELTESAVLPYEIIEAVTDHRKYSLPLALANSVARRRLSMSDARTLPIADRKSDPAFPHD